jgi:hypothetical protein
MELDLTSSSKKNPHHFSSKDLGERASAVLSNAKENRSSNMDMPLKKTKINKGKG